ncbi:MAG: DUF427 domain-containing protein [Algoriphagus sp.]|uniref:DUF427 domain-containing protein n=1 Tax=Algoriphagus sp. TaxID=1872435 RepID=UPI002605BC6C|nr:DUF427 domain-containing protein [Algoriphagus sp.]MDG1278028.1 DUF427 domain-containing protein [Algoriphagus sp.]
MKAIWNNQIIAESDQTLVIEGNHYFPPDAVRMEYLKFSPTQTTCPWKGRAPYYTIEVDGETDKDAAWFYPDPSPAAKEIEGYISFWKRVKVLE